MNNSNKCGTAGHVGGHPKDLVTRRLRVLLALAHRKGQPEISNAEIASRISRQLGEVHGVPAELVSRWRAGTATPSQRHLDALAAAFSAPADYFIDSASGAEAEDRLVLLADIRDRYDADGLNIIARGGRQLTATQLEQIRAALHQSESPRADAD